MYGIYKNVLEICHCLRLVIMSKLTENCFLNQVLVFQQRVMRG